MPAIFLALREPTWVAKLPSQSALIAVAKLSSAPDVVTITHRQAPATAPATATSATSSPINSAIEKPKPEVVGGVIVGSLTIFILLVVFACVCCHRRGSGSSGKRSTSSSTPSSPQPPPVNFPGGVGHTPGPRSHHNTRPASRNRPPSRRQSTLGPRATPPHASHQQQPQQWISRSATAPVELAASPPIPPPQPAKAMARKKGEDGKKGPVSIVERAPVRRPGRGGRHSARVVGDVNVPKESFVAYF